MNEEEYKKEIMRRDEIIDSYQGLQLDINFFNAKLIAIKCIIESKAREHEKLKMIRALIVFA